MKTIYRHYRPITFGDIRGQSHVTGTLQQAVCKKRVAHAYLFWGPRGTGKTTTARVFAKRINCLRATTEDLEACEECAVCTACREQSNLDIIEIDAASHRGIDDIRALREAVGLKPSLGKYKVYIIDEVHMLTHEAFSALLKTLEEPATHVIFILATTEFHKVPATILSRCQVFRFRRASASELQERLKYILKAEKRRADDDALDFIISRSDGCYRDAESLLGQILAAREGVVTKKDLIEFLGLPSAQLITTFLHSLLVGSSAPAIEVVDTVLKQGFDPEQFLQEAILTARDALVSAAKGETVPDWADHPEVVVKLTQIIRTLLLATADFAYVPQPAVALHLAIMSLCTAKGTALKSKVTARAKTPPPATEEKPAINHGLSKEDVKKVWPELIAAVKVSNPVAATFLRAIEPTSVRGDLITLRARFSLHRNFFTKPDHTHMIEQNLGQLLKATVKVECVLEDTAPASLKSAAATEDLYQTVKEVFGEAVQG